MVKQVKKKGRRFWVWREGRGGVVFFNSEIIQLRVDIIGPTRVIDGGSTLIDLLCGLRSLHLEDQTHEDMVVS